MAGLDLDRWGDADMTPAEQAEYDRKVEMMQLARQQEAMSAGKSQEQAEAQSYAEAQGAGGGGMPPPTPPAEAQMAPATAAPPGPPPARGDIATGGAAAGGGPAGPPMIPYSALGAAAGPAHAVGYSPSDRALLGAEGERVGQQQELAGNAVKSLVDIADQHQAATQAFADEANVAQGKFDEGQKRDTERRAAIEADYKQRQARTEEQMSKLDAQGIDPDHYWHVAGTGARILAGIAIGLGEFGATLSHRDNTALKIIDGAVNADIDAQRENLHKSLEVLSKRQGIDMDSFHVQDALVKAEQDSTMAAYNAAIAKAQKVSAQYGQNADVQTKITNMVDGLQSTLLDKMGQYNEKRWQLGKAAEKVVQPAGGTDLSEKIRKRAMEIEDEAAKGGRDVSPADAQRRAILDVTGRDIVPGAPIASYAKEAAAGGGNSARAARLKTDPANAVTELEALKKRIGDTVIPGPGDRAAYDEARTSLETKHGVKLPEASYWHAAGGGGVGAAIDAALLQKKAELAHAKLYTGGGGVDDSETNPDVTKD